MTEDDARRICHELQAIYCVRKRRNTYYVYVSRWLPGYAAAAAGYKVGPSRGQQFDRYVCPYTRLHELEEETLRQRIAELPINPNKLPKDSQHIERSTPTLARWHAEAQTPPEQAPEPVPEPKRRTRRRKP